MTVADGSAVTAAGSEAGRAAPAPRRRHLGRKAREALLGYALVLPALLVFAVFVFYPFFKNFYLGMYRAPLFGSGLGTYVGFEQWKVVLDLPVLLRVVLISMGVSLVVTFLIAVLPRMIRRDPSAHERTRRFGTIAAVFLIITLFLVLFLFPQESDTPFAKSLWITTKFWLFTVPPVIVLGTLLAVLGHNALKGIGVFRTLFMLSIATGVGVAGTIFFTLLNPQVGLLPWLGLDVKPPPLQNPTWALPSVATLAIWINLSLAFIVLSAGLQSIPDELYEAARVDGGGPLRRFWQVTVPMLSPTLMFVFVIGSITALIQSFPYIDITTGDNSRAVNTATLPWLIVDTLRGTSPDRGKAAILSVALFMIALVLTLIQITVLERRVYYGSERE